MNERTRQVIKAEIRVWIVATTLFLLYTGAYKWLL